jgi:hypothetical protein
MGNYRKPGVEPLDAHMLFVLEPTLKSAAKRIAREQDCSLSAWVRTAMREAVARHSRKARSGLASAKSVDNCSAIALS